MDGRNASEVRPATLRLFISLDVPQSVKAEIQRAQEQLCRELPEQSARWTRPEQFHLTLKFLGNVDESRVGALAEVLAATGRRFAPLKLRAERVGCFPDLRFPRVVWVGIHEATGQLAGLASAIEDATANFSQEAREAKFSGHITIARIKNLRRPQAELLAKLAGRMDERLFGEWTVEFIDIMRSELAAGGARHTCLRQLPLGRPPG